MKNKISLLIFISTVVFLFAQPDIIRAATYTCSTCAGCTTQIASASSGDTVQLNSDITELTNTCIDFNQKSGVIFNCQGHTLTGPFSGSTPPYIFGIEFDSSDNNTLRNCNVNNFYDNVEVLTGSNNSFQNVITNNGFQNGFFISQGSNNSVTNCSATGNNNRGIYFYFETGGSMTNSTADSDFMGITLEYSSGVTVDNLTIDGNTYGIDLAYASSNTIKNSHILNSGQYGGLYMPPGDPNSVYSQYNTIYNDYFSNDLNVNNVDSGNQPNYFNTTLDCSSGRNIVGGLCIGGNYWSNPVATGYSDTCTDANKNGVCDSTYSLFTGNVDNDPLAVGDRIAPRGPTSLIVY